MIESSEEPTNALVLQFLLLNDQITELRNYRPPEKIVALLPQNCLPNVEVLHRDLCAFLLGPLSDGESRGTSPSVTR